MLPDEIARAQPTGNQRHVWLDLRFMAPEETGLGPHAANAEPMIDYTIEFVRSPPSVACGHSTSTGAKACPTSRKQGRPRLLALLVALLAKLSRADLSSIQMYWWWKMRHPSYPLFSVLKLAAHIKCWCMEGTLLATDNMPAVQN